MHFKSALLLLSVAASQGSTTPGILVREDQQIIQGQSFSCNNSDNKCATGVTLTQMDDGRLCATRDGDGATLWCSTVSQTAVQAECIANGQPFYTMLQSDGHFITRCGNPSAGGNPYVWKSGATSVQENGNYLLLLNADESMSVVNEIYHIATSAGPPGTPPPTTATPATPPPSKTPATPTPSEPTPKPSADSIASCTVLEDNVFVEEGDDIVITDCVPSFDVTVEQFDTALLCVTIGNSYEWCNSPNFRFPEDENGPFFSLLQGDGNLVTKVGSKGNIGRAVFATGTNRGSGDYTLRLTYDTSSSPPFYLEVADGTSAVSGWQGTFTAL